MPKGTSIGENLTEEQRKALAEGAGKVPAEKVNEDKPNRGARPRYKNPDTVEDALKHYPAHVVKLVNLVKSNSDIRRYTALGILNYLYQKGVIEEAKGYVSFNWTKFRVVNKGLSTEYRYVEPFFLNCLIASFTSFANAAQKIIKVFCSKEYEEAFNEDKAIVEAAIEAANEADAASGEE